MLLEVMPMARSTYYFEISKADPDELKNAGLMKEIGTIFADNRGTYGVRRIHAELCNRKYRVNHKKVQRLMHKLNLRGKVPKEKYHSYHGNVGKTVPNIINRDFSTTKPVEKWTTDVTQFSFSWGKCYLSPILDMHTNEIVSHDLSLHANMAQIARMLKTAFRKFPNTKGLILHSDQGWQYQSRYYQNMLKQHGVIQSMSRKGNCYDNSIMESFFARLKNEMYYGKEKEYGSFKEFSKAIREYIDYYNNRRIQAKTKWMPPVKYREASID